jgi:2-dehydro-3-deoxyphosphogluconate aldolase/(4S)-4-hydroxy-2-oxoglutarate aldolase
MDLLTKLEQRRLLAIVRCEDPAVALRCIDVLAEEGVDLIEVSLTSTDALAVIAEAGAHLDDRVALGAGTVMTADQAQAAVDAGATYLVTPSISRGAAEGIRLGVPVLVGALTPTEVTTAVAEGATAVKLFPADAFGAGYLSALRGPFPDVPFVPVGGVDVDTTDAFLAAGAVAVGVGSPLLGDAARGGSVGALRSRACEYRRRITALDPERP